MEIRRKARYRPWIIARHELPQQSSPNLNLKPRTEMNSSPFISHHLFVSAAGQEKRAQVRPSRNQKEGKVANRPPSRRDAVEKRGLESEVPCQLELLAGVAGAG